MKIGYVSKDNPFTDRKAFSGTVFMIREAMEKAGFEVMWIPIHGNIADRIGKYIFKIFFFRERFRFTTFAAKIRAFYTEKEKFNDCDALFFVADTHSLLPYLTKTKPVILYIDATYLQLMDYYWPKRSNFVYNNSNRAEQEGLNCGDLIICASNWTAQSCINDYNIPKEKIRVLEFGANVDEHDLNQVEPYKSGELRVLFSGIDWKRKGAEVAIDTVHELVRRGIPARLLLVGIKLFNIPQKYQNLPFVDYIGFLNKNDAQQYSLYISTINSAHIFLLPTRAECTGTVFAEASALGLPIFTYDTGGVADYVVENVNGHRLPLTSTYKDFADAIQNSIANNEFIHFYEGGRKMFHEKLSWTAWSKRFKQIMDDYFK